MTVAVPLSAFLSTMFLLRVKSFLTLQPNSAFSTLRISTLRTPRFPPNQNNLQPAQVVYRSSLFFFLSRNADCIEIIF